jgi:cell wall-associated NlpC family hydrolase
LSAKAVIDVAIKEVGYKEGQSNDNKYAALAGHANHQAWCATFVYAMFKTAGEAKAIPNTAYCPAIEAWARANNSIVPLSESKAGDLVLFDFTRSGKAEHVGIQSVDFSAKSPDRIRTIDGNSSSSASGSQSNGDGVVSKNRPVSLVRLIVRPKWSNK